MPDSLPNAGNAPQAPARSWLACSLLVMVAAFTLTGCGESPSLEDRLRETLGKMEAAIEHRNVDDFMEHVSEAYGDEQFRGWNDVRRIVQLYVLRNKNLHLFQHVTQLEIIEDKVADVVVLVAVAGQSIESAGALSTLKAELMRFEVGFVFEDEWKAVSAQWSRAGLDEFL